VCCMGKELVAGVVLILAGILFFFNSKNMGEGTYKFYRWFYTKQRLKVMFKIAGVVLFVGGIVLMIVG